MTPWRPWAGPALLAAAVAVLWVGRFIQFDDTSGFGWDKEIGPLGTVAFALAVGSVVVVRRDVVGLRLVGLAYAALTAWVIVESATNDGFRFVHLTGDGEAFQLDLLLVLTSVALLSLPVARANGQGVALRRAALRWLGYVVGTLVVLVVAFMLGAGIYAAQTSPCTGDCDLGGLLGLELAALAFPGCAVFVLLNEVRLWRRSRQGQPPAAR